MNILLVIAILIVGIPLVIIGDVTVRIAEIVYELYLKLRY